MNLPNLLIIGAMKSGTTTLYDDLRQHPSVFFPVDKEPDFFSRPDSTAPEAVEAYAREFKNGAAHPIRAEASTSYTKRPTYEGVAHRAHEVLGEHLRVIYILRDPIKRAISHHHHDYTYGACSKDINEAIREYPLLLDYSRYAYQLEPWLEAFGQDNILLLRFEDYMSERQAGYDRVCAWLGLEQRELDDPNRRMNASSGKPYNIGLWTTIAHSWAYRKLLRPFLSTGVKSWLFKTVLPKAETELTPPNEQTLELMMDSFRDDVDQINERMGGVHPAWDFRRHLKSSDTRQDPAQKAPA